MAKSGCREPAGNIWDLGGVRFWQISVVSEFSEVSENLTRFLELSEFFERFAEFS